MKDMAPERRASRSRDDDTTIAIKAVVGKLEVEAERRVGLRSSVEARWLQDLMQYHGRYNETLATDLENEKKSTLFINMTGPKTDAVSAKMMDMLFPTEDRNWDLRPSPVPEMDDAEKVVQRAMDRAKKTFSRAQEMWDDPREDRTPEFFQKADEQRAQAEAQISEAQDALDKMQVLRDEAARRAEMMVAEMDDQLKSSGYDPQCRDVIEDGNKIGTGVIYGPVLQEKQHLRWNPIKTKTEDGEATSFQMVSAMDLRPGFQRRDPWGFFPDPDARTVDECEGFFYRHLMTRKALRKHAERPGIDVDAVRHILSADPQNNTPQGMSDLYAITNDSNHKGEGKYHVWEYIGPVEGEDVLEILSAYEDMELAVEIFGADREIDPLIEVHARIEFCQGEILSFALHPLESNEAVYSIYNPKKAEIGLFGYGIPYLMRDAQSAFNAAWRAMMDNAKLAIAPQIVVNKEVIKPDDNGHNYDLEGGRVWVRVNGEDQNPAFEAYEIPVNQNYLGAIIEMARMFMDEVTSMPQIAQGEQGTGVTKTAQGMALLMNASNVVFRRMIKNWDDDITIPNIRRLYDFNMQFSENEDIKGDYEPVAIGSSVLLVREMQSTNLMNIAMQFGEHPEYGIWLKKPELMKEIFKTSMVSTTSIMRTQAEVDEILSKQSKSDPVTDLKMRELDLRQRDIEMRMATTEMETDARIKQAEMQYAARMEAIAAQLNISVEALESKAKIEDKKIEAQDRGRAVDAALLQRTGKSVLSSA